jgi:tetratricopeptide (TPR) repeat protein
MFKPRLLQTLLLLTLLALGACSSAPRLTQQQVLEHHRELLRGSALFPADEPLPELEPVELLAINDDMRAFLDEHVPVKSVSDEIKTDRILRALLRDGLQLEYSNLKTYTAEQTFYAREGNCLSFTNLFIALARAEGVIASYQEVEVPPAWSAVGDTYYFSLHINVLVDLPRKQKIVDFDVQNRSDRTVGRPVGDNVALAQYHNNMAVYYLGENDLRNAFVHSRKAIELGPLTGYFWANLGTIFKRAQALDEAEEAYLAAISIDDELSAISNLARLYQQRGETELAAIYRARADRYRAENPYFLYELASTAYDAGHYLEAADYLQSAIKKRRDEHEFYRLLGLSWTKLGDMDAAEASFAKAARYATDPRQHDLYEHKLRLLANTGSQGG